MRIRVLFGVASAVAMVGMLWGSVTPAHACSCAPASFVDRDFVVIGRVVEMFQVREEDESRAGVVIDWDAIFAVERYFKGQGHAEILVDDPAHGGVCGFLDENEAGEWYVLSLSREGSRYVTDSCSPAESLGGESAVRKAIARLESEFGSGNAPRPGSSLDHDTPFLPAVAIAAVLGPLAFLSGAAFLWRRGEPHNG